MWRRIIIVSVVLLIILAYGLFGGNKKTKLLKAEGTVEDWNRVYRVIDTSAASHLEVRWVKDFIFGQLSTQIDTTAKR